MKRWLWPIMAVAVVLAWGVWPFQPATGENVPRERVWTGWVTDAASRPIRAAVVVVDPPSGAGGAARVAETDREGCFRMPDPPSGRHSLLIGQIHYLPMVIDTFEIDPTRPPRAFVLRQTERVIEGEVRDRAGAPIAWARVAYPAEVFAPEEMKVVRTRLAVRTDAKGRFRIARGVRADAPCRIEVTRTGFTSAKTEVDLAGGDPPPLEIRLDPLPSAVIEGLIVGPDGLPATGARIEVRDGNVVRCTLTDDEGRFAVGGLAEGPVDLFVQPSTIGLRAGFAPARRENVAAPGSVRIDLALVPANERPGAIALSFQVPETATPVEAYWIREEASAFEELRVNGGRCSAYQGGLSPGPVHVFVRAGDWMASEPVNVPPGETARVTLALREGSFVRLRVRDGEGGPPVMGAIALPYVDAPDGAAFELPPSTADDRGEIELRGLPEGCRVEVSAPGREPREVIPDRSEKDIPLERRQ